MIDNRPGASGIIGTELVAKSAPDGYTLLIGITGTLAINPAMFPKLPYDSIRDFAPISLAAVGPNILVVHPSLPVRSVKELIVFCKQHPGKLSYASSGTGGAPHLAGELFKSMAGVNLVHVPYKGAAPATIDVLGGHVPIMFAGMGAALPHIAGGAELSATMTPELRSRLLAAMPGLKERAKTLIELIDSAGFLFAERPIGLDDKAKVVMTDEARELLKALLPDLEAVEPWAAASAEQTVRAFAERAGVKLGAVAQPLRTALTGRVTSPGIFDVLIVLGKTESLGRLRDQADKAGG